MALRTRLSRARWTATGPPPLRRTEALALLAPDDAAASATALLSSKRESGALQCRSCFRDEHALINALARRAARPERHALGSGVPDAWLTHAEQVLRLAEATSALRTQAAEVEALRTQLAAMQAALQKYGEERPPEETPGLVKLLTRAIKEGKCMEGTPVSVHAV